jgi:hypothetical protein
MGRAPRSVVIANASLARRGMSAISLLAAAALAIVVLTTVVPKIAFADATPVQLVLIYMPNVSNTGTSTASGIAELVMPEGEVRITAADLPRLDGTKQYVAWVVNTDTSDFRMLGTFNTAESSSAVHYENVLADAIPDHHWNLLLVTVEGSSTPARPSSQHSIAGVFPSADNVPLPIVLPNTGGGDPYSLPAPDRSGWLLTAGLAALMATLGLASGYVLGLKKR